MLTTAVYNSYTDLNIPFQRIFESDFVGRRSIVKERFSKKYRHPTLDSKLTLKRLNAVSFSLLNWLSDFHTIIDEASLCFLSDVFVS